MSEPRVSIIIPLYQSAATVAETVRSVQKDVVEGGMEIIVVNDGSTDEGPAIVEAMARQDSRIRLLHRPNGGLGAARNTGIDAARGRYIRFLDADDWTPPGATTRLLDAAECSGSGAACGTMDLRDWEGRTLHRSIPARHGADRTVGLDQLLDSNAMGVGTVLLRREVLGDLRFRPFWGCEDYDLWVRLALNGVRFAVVGEPAVKWYRLHATSMSRNFGRMCASLLEVQRHAFEAASASGRFGTLDLSAERKRRVAAGVALSFASMSAAAGDLDGGASILDASGVVGACAGSDVGVAFIVGVAQTLAVGPQERGEARAEWVVGGYRWLEMLEHRGAVTRRGREDAWRAMAESIVTPEMIAEELADLVLDNGAKEAVLLGFGRNGRLLACELVDRGVHVRVRDARWQDGRASAGETRLLLRGGEWVSAETEAMSAAIQGGVPVVITPFDDSGFLGAPGRADALRWRKFAARQAEAEHADLARLLASAGLPAAPALERGCPSGR